MVSQNHKPKPENCFQNTNLNPNLVPKSTNLNPNLVPKSTNLNPKMVSKSTNLNPNLVSKSKNQNPKRQNEVPCTFAVKGVHTSGNHHKSIPHRCHVSTCRQDPMLFFPAGGSVCVSLRRHVMRCLA